MTLLARQEIMCYRHHCLRVCVCVFLLLDKSCMHSLKQEKTNLCTVFCVCDVLNLSHGKVVRVALKLQMPRYVQSFYFFSLADHHYTTWQNRKWLYFPASCSDGEQGCILAIPFLPSGSPSSCYCLINVPHFLSLSWLHFLGEGRQEVKALVLDRKFKVREPWCTD